MKCKQSCTSACTVYHTHHTFNYVKLSTLCTFARNALNVKCFVSADTICTYLHSFALQSALRPVFLCWYGSVGKGLLRLLLWEDNFLVTGVRNYICSV